MMKMGSSFIDLHRKFFSLFMRIRYGGEKYKLENETVLKCCELLLGEELVTDSSYCLFEVYHRNYYVIRFFIELLLLKTILLLRGFWKQN
jgi:hypothetical protein